MPFFDSWRAGFVADMGRCPVVFDPSILSDPVAIRVDWEPNSSQGKGFPSHRWKKVSDLRAEYRPNLVARVIAVLLATVGMAILRAAFREFIAPTCEWLGVIVGSLFGGLFLGYGIFILLQTRSRHVFDKTLGVWWSGSVPPSKDPSLYTQDLAGHIAQIHAIQFLWKNISDDRRRTISCWETNLGFHNGDRYSVSNQMGNGNSADARALAKFLNVPFWTREMATRSANPSDS